MKVIDMHSHTYPDHVAPRAMANLAAATAALPGGSLVPVTDGTFADTLALMERSGIDGWAPLNIVTNPKNQSSATEYSASLKRSNVFPFGSVHPLCEDIEGAVREIKAAGLYGVKLHPDYQNFLADDRAVYPIYEACAENGLPVAFHAGFDPVSPEVVHCTPAMLARVAEDFPTLQIIAAHMGGEQMWDEVEAQLVGRENVWLDTSMTAGLIDNAQMKRIIENHRQVLFGSDCPWHSPALELEHLLSLGLDKELEEDVLHRNAEKLLGL